MLSRPILRAAPIRPRLRLVLLAFLVLFVELALIRWTGANVVYLSFFSNFVLLGSFLGIGLGFLRARSMLDFFPWSPVALAALVGFVLFFPVKIDRSGSDLIFFGELQTRGLPTWVMLPVIFLAVAGVMAMLAEGMARQFGKFEPLEAYRLDILGSILGILGFTALSFLGAPPIAWGGVAVALMVFLIPPSLSVVHVISFAALLVFLGIESLTPGYSWSPYYRIGALTQSDGSTGVEVNGIPHQLILPVEEMGTVEPLYEMPYQRAKAEPENVLVIGAGTGNDVAWALSKGARAVDAVEIDPGLQRLGEELHPSQPYVDPRVEVHIADGRAFLQQDGPQYDLILFALPDSLTLVSGQAALRLESYLFTLEAMEAARDRLAPGGAFSMYNFYREEWLVDRLAGTLNQAFGHAPCVDTLGEAGKRAVLTVGRAVSDITCEQPWTATGDVVPPSRDDYPFLYLREASIPGFYLIAMALILTAGAVLIRVTAGTFRGMGAYTDLFFMGAAFLLLETKSVVQFALLFGTTWFVNSVVFVGVLASVYMAIEVTRRVRLPSPILLYLLLVSSVLLATLVPLHSLLALPLPLRFIAAIMLWFTPIFIANLVFAQRFESVGETTVAFGTNLLGAVVGGVIEYAALMTGYTALAFLVAALYGAAFVFGAWLTRNRAAVGFVRAAE